MKYDFDSIVERRHTHSTKWLKFSDPNIIPMWIADMDFACPKEITDPMRERVDQGIFGYTDTPDELTQILKDRIKLRSGWDIEEEWVVWVPGAVVALNLACKTALAPGEIVVTPSPIYAPFEDASENMDRGMVKNFLVDNNGRMELDFEATEELLSKDTKMLFFCNPHNPGGTVFNKNEITTLVEICERHNITICSDEIHCDLILQDDLEHFHLASLNEYAKENSITILGPCKTFNLAGFPLAASIIPNKELREDFIRNTVVTIEHPACTCPMGNNSRAVLTPKLKVRGIERLRVVDGSAMPDLTSAHINSTILMMAEKASDMILGKAPLPAQQLN